METSNFDRECPTTLWDLLTADGPIVKKRRLVGSNRSVGSRSNELPPSSSSTCGAVPTFRYKCAADRDSEVSDEVLWIPYKKRKRREPATDATDEKGPRTRQRASISRQFSKSQLSVADRKCSTPDDDSFYDEWAPFEHGDVKGKVSIEDLISGELENLDTKLELLDEWSMATALQSYVENQSTQAIQDTVLHLIDKKQQSLIQVGLVDEQNHVGVTQKDHANRVLK
jgi:citrate lyase gamma subunit